MNMRVVAVLMMTVFSQPALALFEPLFDDGTWSAEMNGEWRYFNDPGEFGQSRSALSFSAQAEYYTDWNDGVDSFTFTPFMRIDQIDDERTHLDLREAYWGHVSDNWETKVGFTRVFWGRTEFLNLVDVVNQKDFVEGDTTEKLGQPLMQLSLVHEVVILDFYVLTGFRERTFQGEDGRLRAPIGIDTDNARYEGVDQNNIDFAVRWSQPLTDDLEMAFSIFSGTNRDPRFDFNYDLFDPKLIPVYTHMDQFGLELEYIYEGWVAKLEAVSVETPKESYTAAVGGVEYTFDGVFESDLDVTLIAEYLWDERGSASPGFFEHDLGFGTRITFNDEQSTEILVGGIFDFDTDEALYSLEASRRIGESWRVEILATIVAERGEQELGQTVSEIATILADSGFVADDLSAQFAIDLITDIIDEKGLLFLFTEVNTYDDFVNTLQQVQRLADTDRKLSILESDDYVQVEVKYFY
ncbi:hypothetical protein A9Q99_10010 [Gammaproteobacteria bacterium 45_16_T64]|nr:hypothetical protein A9Q99_10010 [Gammaproteobacteria bacterium 45_16_T64]